MDGLVLASVQLAEESEHKLQREEEDVLDLLLSDSDDEVTVLDPGTTDMDEKITSSSPLQGDDVNDAIDVIYLFSDDSDHEETNEVVNKTYHPVKWASMWPGIGCGECTVKKIERNFFHIMKDAPTFFHTSEINLL